MIPTWHYLYHLAKLIYERWRTYVCEGNKISNFTKPVPSRQVIQPVWSDSISGHIFHLTEIFSVGKLIVTIKNQILFYLRNEISFMGLLSLLFFSSTIAYNKKLRVNRNKNSCTLLSSLIMITFTPFIFQLHCPDHTHF